MPAFKQGKRTILRKQVQRAARFTFVTIPAGIVGWNLNRQLFGWVQWLWKRTVRPACPQCERGLLVPQDPITPSSHSRSGDPVTIAWLCDDCGLVIAGPRKLSAFRKTALAPARQVRAQAVFHTLPGNQRERLARKHQVGSRVLYVVALATFANFLHMIASGVALVVVANWASFSVMFGVLGLKRAYRAWQLRSGHLFEAGAFWYWLRHERWLC